jgi:hypothetical protein
MKPASWGNLPLLPLILLPLAKLLVHLATYRGYGMFRDEYYYLACADHLAWGYVDQPPFSIAVLWLGKLLLGDSLLAVRLLPALAGAGTVFLAGLIARRLGGGVAGQSLAMVAVLAAPYYLALDHFFSMNAFDILIWALVAYLVVDLIQAESMSSWIFLGTALGLGLMNKVSVLWLGAGLFVGIVATDRRRWLRTSGPWLAAGVAGLLFMPHIAWQVANDWPTLEFIRNASQNKMVSVQPIQFLTRQITMMNPLSLPLWLGGLIWLLLSRKGRQYRLLGIIYLTAFALLLLNGTSRAGYLGPAYTWLLAAGGVWVEGLCRSGRWRMVPWVAAGLVLMSGAALAPLALPILPVERYIPYAAALGEEPSTEERKEVAALGQFYADMHGWEAIVETVAAAYDQLTPEEKKNAAIFTSNYGDAGAITRLGRPLGLPAAISGHNNYWLWGPGNADGQVVIVLGSTRGDLEADYASVQQAGMVDCGYCMPYENNRPVWICRGLKKSVAEAWPGVKHYD